MVHGTLTFAFEWALILSTDWILL